MIAFPLHPRSVSLRLLLLTSRHPRSVIGPPAPSAGRKAIDRDRKLVCIVPCISPGFPLARSDRKGGQGMIEIVPALPVVRGGPATTVFGTRHSASSTFGAVRTRLVQSVFEV
jgi:hypothetical protein